MVCPLPSHEALQYLPPSCGGQVQAGFLHLFFPLSSAIFPPEIQLGFYVCLEISTKLSNLRSERDGDFGGHVSVVFEQGHVGPQSRTLASFCHLRE